MKDPHMIPAEFSRALESFRCFLDDLHVNDANEIGETARQHLLRQFEQYHAEMAKALEAKASAYEAAKLQYRTTVNPILREGEIIRRNIDIPRGYYGDYQTMEMMYRNEFEGSTPRGKLLHKIVVDGRECGSVRKRKQHLQSRIIELVDKEQAQSVSLCSLAAGPAAELRGIPEATQQKIGRVVLIDQDKEALEYAFKNLPEHLQSVCQCVVASVADVVFRKVECTEHPQFNYVYSAGLFDYLDDPTAKALVRRVTSIANHST
ncbi:MAG: class I SAM-dependent methyltransferase family protein [bacterium]|nr:class I SAM-dependent methyltransferase family protein [bacterium]